MTEKEKPRGQGGNTQGSAELKRLLDVSSSASLEEVSPENPDQEALKDRLNTSILTPLATCPKPKHN